MNSRFHAYSFTALALFMSISMLNLFLPDSASASGFVTKAPKEKRNLCAASLMSPLQIQLKLEAEAKSVKIDLEKLSKEVGRDRIMEDYFRSRPGEAEAAVKA